jgi:predicted Zn-dependent peptidase
MKKCSGVLWVAALAPLAALAQKSPNPEPPVLGPPPALTVPAVRSTTLANGVQLRVVEQRELPLVQVLLVVSGGARLDGDRPGLATFMANMLDEGAGGRDALALQSELAYLGASLSTAADWDQVTVSLRVPVRNLRPALDLMADVVLRPSFSSAEVRRQQQLRLAALLQQRDQPNSLADLAFHRVLFPPQHPYSRSLQGDSASTVGFDSATVRTFYERVMQPRRATIYVVGDIDEPQARELLSPRFGAWRATTTPSALPAAPDVNAPDTRRVYLVDKPGAAQSVINIGWPGVERRSSDYPAIVVMNTLLGGSFTSRLNMNLRETKGYTYGASSRFVFRPLPGPFIASAAVRTNVTDSSLVEFFKELNALRETPVPAEELERAKAYVELGLPGGLETVSQVAGQMNQLELFGLTLDELPRFSAAVRAVTPADVQRVARKYLIPERAVVVIVGDLAAIRKPVEALGLGPVTVLEVASLAR